MNVTRRRMAMIAVLAVLAGACGGGSETDTGTGTTVDDTSAGGSATTGTQAEATGNGDDQGEGEPETLGDFLWFGFFDDPEANAAFAADMERRVQESIALCMAQEGFEYIPAVRPQASGFFSLNEEEYARERGFGITTWFGEEGIYLSEDEDWVDPNDEIVAALSESERNAYQEVLYGEDPFGESGSGDIESVGDLWGSGCNGKAYEEVDGAMTAVFTELGPQLEELNHRFKADPRFREAEEMWAGCMADRGFPYDSRETMYEQVNEEFLRRLEEIVGMEDGAFDPLAGMSEEEAEQFLEERSEDEIFVFSDQAGQEAMAGIDQEALAALQQEERDIAVASFECGEELNDTVQEVFREHEGDFVRENRAVLERLRT